LSMGASGADQGPQHRPPEERKRGVAQYSADAYPEGAPLRDEQHGWLTAVRATSEYAQGKIAVEAVNDAKQARGKGDYPAATAAIAKAAQTSFRATPLVVNESARLRDDMGDAAGADRLFALANASPDQTIDGYLDHSRMLYRTGQNERALAIIQQGTARFGNDPKPFLSLLIGVSLQSGRKDEAARYLQQCLAYNDQSLAQDCRLAAGGGKEQHKGPFGFPHLPL
jgi:tetratricopeptide (TPR) repeat protein